MQMTNVSTVSDLCKLIKQTLNCMNFEYYTIILSSNVI